MNTEIKIRGEKYLLSEDKVQVGDYITDGYRIWLYDSTETLVLNRKKIIATTNTKLKLPALNF